MSDHDHEIDAIPQTTPIYINPQDTITTSPELETSAPIIDNPQTIDLNLANQNLDLSPTISRSQEKTRARIAWTFTQIFLLLIIFATLLPLIINLIQPQTFSDPIETSTKLLTILTSTLGGPFGFIVGFYFKESQDNDY